MKKNTQKILTLCIMLAAFSLCIIPFWAGAEGVDATKVVFNPLEIVQQYALVPVTLACLLTGWMLKHIVTSLDNKWIPLILSMVGIVGVLWMNAWALTPANFLSGLCSAALAVWIHNNYKNLSQNKEMKPPEQ